MPRQRGQSGARFGVPQSRRLVSRCGDDPRTVWAECRTGHSIRVPRKRGQRSACRSVPQSCGVIERRGDDARTVRAERRTVHPIRVPRECGESGARVGIPQSRGVVESCGDDARTVRAERGTDYPILVAQERGESGARLGIPYSRSVIVGGGDHARTVGSNVALFTAAVCLESVTTTVPVVESHIRAVLSSDAVTMREPSGLNAALFTASVCPENIARGAAFLEVPNARGFVLGCSDDTGTVRAERRPEYWARMPRERGEQQRPCWRPTRAPSCPPMQ